MKNATNVLENESLANEDKLAKEFTQSLNSTRVYSNDQTSIIPIIGGAVGGLLVIVVAVAIFVVKGRKHTKVRKIDVADVTKTDVESHVNILFDKVKNKTFVQPMKIDHSRVKDIGVASQRFSMKPTSIKMEYNSFALKPQARPLSVKKPMISIIPTITTIPDEIKSSKQVHNIKKVMLPVRPAIQKEEFASYNIYNKRSSLRF